jgi:hypothetical protein
MSFDATGVIRCRGMLGLIVPLNGNRVLFWSRDVPLNRNRVLFGVVLFHLTGTEFLKIGGVVQVDCSAGSASGLPRALWSSGVFVHGIPSGCRHAVAMIRPVCSVTSLEVVVVCFPVVQRPVSSHDCSCSRFVDVSKVRSGSLPFTCYLLVKYFVIKRNTGVITCLEYKN